MGVSSGPNLWGNRIGCRYFEDFYRGIKHEGGKNICKRDVRF